VAKKKPGPKTQIRSRPDRARFATEYLIDLNATKAAERCGYSPKTAGAQGARLLKSVDIAAKVAEAMAKRVERVEIKADDVLTRWDRRARANAADFLTFRIRARRVKKLMTYHEAAELIEVEISDEKEFAKRSKLAKEALTASHCLVADLQAKALRYRIRSERDPVALVEIETGIAEEEVAEFDIVRLRDAQRLDMVKAVKQDRDGTVTVTMHDAAQADDAIAQHLGMYTKKVELTGKNGAALIPKAIVIKLVRP
jgi:phage terminase small subunit